jgi:hypothetical protein
MSNWLRFRWIWKLCCIISSSDLRNWIWKRWVWTLWSSYTNVCTSNCMLKWRIQWWRWWLLPKVSKSIMCIRVGIWWIRRMCSICFWLFIIYFISIKMFRWLLVWRSRRLLSNVIIVIMRKGIFEIWINLLLYAFRSLLHFSS